LAEDPDRQFRRAAARCIVFLRRRTTPPVWVVGAIVLMVVLMFIWLSVYVVLTAGHNDRTAARTASMEHRLDRLELTQERLPVSDRRRNIVALLRRNTLALGVQFEDTSGAQKVIWKGTGFVLFQSPYDGTAAHVLEELETYRFDLKRKGLKPRIIAKTWDGSVRESTQVNYHPSFPKRDERHSAQPTLFFLDLALFAYGPQPNSHNGTSPGLEFCVDVPIVVVGQEVAVAGFPTEVASVGYPESPGGLLAPTVRFGNVERLSGLDTRVSESQDLIQHNLPLVGGFSGAPVVNAKGQLVGITNESSYRLLNAEEIVIGVHGQIASGNTRLLDAADMNFAVNARQLRKWLMSITGEERP
jgi:hypothetical protein